jgi:hypothetical protein
MKPSRVAEVLGQLLNQRWPVFIWGPPGAGKSSVVSQVAKDKGYEVIDIRAPLLDPTDLRGIPTVKDGSARWCPPSFLPSKDQPGILFFDELNAAPPMVQASLYQLTLDGRIGEYVLPAGWRIIAAGNRAEDKALVYRMPSALANRFVHLDFEIDFEDWRHWAIGRGIHPLVTGFLSLRTELLFDMRKPERGFPTPRSWEMASDTIEALGTEGNAADVLLGIVGEGASVEFLSYCESAMTEKEIQALLEDPEEHPLPERIGDLYALVSYLATHASKKNIRNASGMLLERLPPELAILLLRDILRRFPRFAAENAKARRFVASRSDVILG